MSVNLYLSNKPSLKNKVSLINYLYNKTEVLK